MNNAVISTRLAEGIRAIAAARNGDPENDMECYLDQELQGFGLEERLTVLRELADRFKECSAAEDTGDDSKHDDIHQLVARFLGSSSATSTMSPHQLAEKFAGSLDILFDSVNQIVSVIDVTLMGRSQELETIRKVIGANIQGQTDYSSITKYLERIKQSFLIAHQSYQQAATAVIEEILTELDPEVLAKSSSAGLKFGPLRKADLFEQYEEKYSRCKKWFQSENCKEKLLREFERQCQLQISGNRGHV